MRCFVYKSQRRADTFVYLAARDDFEKIPAPLRGSLGALQFVVEFDFGPQRRLAQHDAAVVRNNLLNQGVHIQFPADLTLTHGAG